MKVKSESEAAQSCPTLSDLIDRSLPDSSIYGVFQARVHEWGAIAFSALRASYTLLQEVGKRAGIIIGLHSPSTELNS